MSDTHPDQLEPWSYPIPHLEEQAQVWHARRFAAWLLRAGAETRSSLLFTSGPRATARCQLLLEEQGVDIQSVLSQRERPLPQALTLHRGDHFNRKLFLIDGLDQLTQSLSPEDRAEHWRILEGQRGQLNQGATWVALLIQDPQTLIDAYRWAPQLIKQLQRACWCWDPSERSTTKPVGVLPPYPRPSHRLIGELFISASAQHHISHLHLGRIFRAGYPRPPRYAPQTWRWGFQLWRGEARDATAARFGQMGVTEALSDDVTPADALWALRGRSDAASPARLAQWTERADQAEEAWLLIPHLDLPPHIFKEDPILRRAIYLLKTWGLKTNSLPPSQHLLQQVEEVLSLPDLAGRPQYELSNWLTRAYASEEDLEGCIRVNQCLAQDINALAEARFCAEEKNIDLALFQRDFTEASEAIERLILLETELASPHFESRLLRARAKQLGALDPSRGQREQEEALRIEQRFGLCQPTAP